MLTLALTTLGLAQQPMSFQYVYDDLGQLVKVIDSTGTVIEYVYDPVGNLLEIKRSTLTGLALHSFTPQQGAVGTKVTLQGQGFSAVPAENTVQFHGTTAPVSAATPTSLTVTVPPVATTGPITVTVAGATATSDHDFTVVPVPVITAITPTLALSGSVLPNVQVQGSHLIGATFTFLPAFIPLAITVDSTTIDPMGTAATLRVTVGSSALGSFVVIATNAFGNSDAFSSPANTLRIINNTADDDGDGLTNAEELARGTDPVNRDTDGDGFGDGDEVRTGANPLDPQSIPVYAAYMSFSVFNTTDPGKQVGIAVGPPFSVFNRTDPGQQVGIAVGPPFSVFNGVAPGAVTGHLEGLVFSVKNLSGL
jgi:YD repeat-containing protein